MFAKQSWSWLDDGVLPVLLALLRACWLWPWLVLLADVLAPNRPGAALPAWLVIGLPLLSLTLARYWSRRADQQTAAFGPRGAAMPLRARLAVGLTGVVVTLLVLWWQLYRTEYALLDVRWIDQLSRALLQWDGESIPAAVLVLVTTFLLWLRGLLDAPKKMVHDDVWQAFAVAIVGFVAYILALSAAGRELSGRTGGTVIALFGLGMAGLAFSSLKITAGLDRALGMGQRRGETTPALSRHWFLSVITAIAALLLGGLLISALIAPTVLAQLLNAAGAVVSLIGRVLGAILLTFVYVILMAGYYLAVLLQPLVNRILANWEWPEQVEEMMAEMEPLATPEVQDVAATGTSDSTRWLGLLAIAVVMLIVFALAVRRLRALRQDDPDETRESVLSAELLHEQLRALWDDISRRWRQDAAAQPFLSLEGELSVRQRIRAVYQRLLAAAVLAGEARTPHQTPQTYEQQLALSVTTESMDARTALHQITLAYQQARYADEPPDTQAAERVEAAWQKLSVEFAERIERAAASAHEAEADSDESQRNERDN